MYGRYDELYERFMEKGVHMLNNNNNQPGLEDLLSFPTDSLRTIPTALPQKRIINSRNDSALNSPQTLSLTVTPDNSHKLQPYPLT